MPAARTRLVHVSIRLGVTTRNGFLSRMAFNLRPGGLMLDGNMTIESLDGDKTVR
jgi:hypothetical protein